jgi:hypothetical protein
MRISFVIVLALASALLIAPSAGAKGVTKMEVCGAAQCVALPGDGDDFEALMIGSSAAGPPEGPAGWYSVRSTVTPSREQGEDFEPFTFREAYVPSAGLLRVRAEDGGFQWFDVSARYEAAMKKATAGLEPRPAGRLGGLDLEPVEATVDEIVPAPAREPVDARAGGGAPWGWIALGAAAAGLIAALGLRGRRRSRTVPATG